MFVLLGLCANLERAADRTKLAGEIRVSNESFRSVPPDRVHAPGERHRDAPSQLRKNR